MSSPPKRDTSAVEDTEAPPAPTQGHGNGKEGTKEEPPPGSTSSQPSAEQILQSIEFRLRKSKEIRDEAQATLEEMTKAGHQYSDDPKGQQKKKGNETEDEVDRKRRAARMEKWQEKIKELSEQLEDYYAKIRDIEEEFK
ncbi:hypothetical protein EJ08DRAFT_664408 [Tothia fuscella]|uniref:Uncharacterized protein n=1 Tax=Tothia fuscella TaxID=1048955 RepID=A0A9P4NIY8_9PEZI|nr:hypothetical protein EJ08DRAFT_664408 [Tothia fuscella]